MTNKTTSITIIKCVLISTVGVLQTLVNLPQLESIKIYLSIATGAIVMFETVLEKQIRIIHKQKKYANPAPVVVQYNEMLPETVPSEQPPRIQDRNLQFIHNLAQPSGMDVKGKTRLPERYTEYNKYSVPDFEGGMQYSIASNTPVMNFV